MILNFFKKNRDKAGDRIFSDLLKNKAISFISGFSDSDISISGWSRKDIEMMCRFYENISPFIKEGNYLELGCGSGIFPLFLRAVLEKKITPYGVDVNPRAIEAARNNNPEFADNFVKEENFAFLEREYASLGKFSTISIFIYGEKDWNNLLQLSSKMFSDFPGMTLIICDYDESLLKGDNKAINKFVSEMKKISLPVVVDDFLMVVGLKGSLLAKAEKMRKKALDRKESSGDCGKELIVGRISEKEGNSFVFSSDKYTARFSINDNLQFRTLKFFDSSNIEVKPAKWEDMENGDEVEIMVSCGKDRNLFGVKKII